MKSSRMFKGSIVLLVISLLILFTTSGVLADGDECNHPETIKDYRWGNYDDLAYEDTGSNASHKATGKKHAVTICNQCWAIVNEDFNDITECTEEMLHEYELNESNELVCIRCNHKNTCLHTSFHQNNSWDSQGPSYPENGRSIYYHTATGTGTYSRYCDDCNILLENTTVPEAISVLESHSYNNYVCTDCEYICPHDFDEYGRCKACYYYCQHEQMDGIDLITETVNAYIPKYDDGQPDQNKHNIANCVEKYKQCPDCGQKKILESTISEVTGQEPHVYTSGSGRCEKCGLPCTHDELKNVQETTEQTVAEARLIAKDKQYHVLATYKAIYKTCPHCSASICVNTVILEEKEIPQAHVFNSNGYCETCGYQCPHESYTDGICNNCNYQCGHSFDNGKCTTCGYECPHTEAENSDIIDTQYEWISSDEHRVVLTTVTHISCPTCRYTGTLPSQITEVTESHQDDDGDGICDICYKPTAGSFGWDLNSGKLHLTGCGIVSGYERVADLPWADQIDEIERVFVEGDFVSIGANVLKGLNSETRIDFIQRKMPTIADASAISGVCRYYSTDETWGNAPVGWIYLPIYNPDWETGNDIEYHAETGWSTGKKQWTSWVDYPLTARQAWELAYTGRNVSLYSIPAGDDMAVITDHWDTTWSVTFQEECRGMLNWTLPASTDPAFDVYSPNLTLTIDGTALESLNRILLMSGTMTYTGNVDDLYLHDCKDKLTTLTVNGDVGILNFYDSTSEAPYSGSLTVSGKVKDAVVYGSGTIKIPNISDNVVFPDIAKAIYKNIEQTTPLIEQGELKISGAETSNPTWEDFDLEYHLYSGGWRLRLRASEDSEPSIYPTMIDDVEAYNPNFSVKDILYSTTTDVYIGDVGDTYGTITFDGNKDDKGNVIGLRSLTVVGSDAVVNCPITKRLDVAQYYQSEHPATVTINSSVHQLIMELRKTGNVVTLGQGGSVGSGYWNKYFDENRYFGSATGPCDLFSGEQLKVLSWKEGESTKAILPSEDAMKAAAGIDSDILTVQMDIGDSSKGELTQAEESALEDYLDAEGLGDQAVVSLFDATVNKYSIGSNGDLSDLGEVHELSSPVSITVNNPTENESCYIVRLHDEDGTMTATEMTEPTDEEIIDFYSELFSKYVLVREGSGFDVSDAIPLTLGTKAEVGIEDGARYQLFSFMPDSDGKYEFESFGEEDPYGTLYDSDCKQLQSDDDSGEGRNFRIPRNLEAGKTYYLRVGQRDSEPSTFQVSVHYYAADAPTIDATGEGMEEGRYWAYSTAELLINAKDAKQLNLTVTGPDHYTEEIVFPDDVSWFSDHWNDWETLWGANHEHIYYDIGFSQSGRYTVNARAYYWDEEKPEDLSDAEYQDAEPLTFEVKAKERTTFPQINLGEQHTFTRGTTIKAEVTFTEDANFGGYAQVLNSTGETVLTLETIHSAQTLSISTWGLEAGEYTLRVYNTAYQYDPFYGEETFTITSEGGTIPGSETTWFVNGNAAGTNAHYDMQTGESFDVGLYYPGATRIELTAGQETVAPGPVTRTETVSGDSCVLGGLVYHESGDLLIRARITVPGQEEEQILDCNTLVKILPGSSIPAPIIECDDFHVTGQPLTFKVLPAEGKTAADYSGITLEAEIYWNKTYERIASCELSAVQTVEAAFFAEMHDKDQVTIQVHAYGVGYEETWAWHTVTITDPYEESNDFHISIEAPGNETDENGKVRVPRGLGYNLRISGLPEGTETFSLYQNDMWTDCSVSDLSNGLIIYDGQYSVFEDDLIVARYWDQAKGKYCFSNQLWLTVFCGHNGKEIHYYWDDDAVYTDNHNGTHTVTGTVQREEFCIDCHTVIRVLEPVETTLTEECTFLAGVCTKCGFTCPHEGQVVYVTLDENQHQVTILEDCPLCYCNETEPSTYSEAHVDTDENGICDKCGYTTGNWQWAIKGSTLTVSADTTEATVISGFSADVHAPWYSKRNAIKRIVLKGNISGIDAYSFAGFTHVRVDMMGASLPTIADNAFADTTAVCRYYSDTAWEGAGGTYGGTLTWVRLPQYAEDAAPTLYYSSTGWWIAGESSSIPLDRQQAVEILFNGEEIELQEIPTSAEDQNVYEQHWDLVQTLRIQGATGTEQTLSIGGDASVSIQSPGLGLSISGDINSLSFCAGNITVNGDIGILSLGHTESDNPGGLTVNGDVDLLRIQSGADDGFKGNLTVKGTISKGKVLGQNTISITGIGNNIPIDNQSVGVFYFITQTTPVVENGELKIPGVTPVYHLDDSECKFVYSYNEDKEHKWSVYYSHPATSTGGIIDIADYNPGFTMNDILWNKRNSLEINGNKQTEITVGYNQGKGLGGLSIYGGNVTVNCPVSVLRVCDDLREQQPTTLTINSKIGNIFIYEVKGKTNLIQTGSNGTVQSGLWVKQLGSDQYYFESVGAGKTIVENSVLKIMTHRQGQQIAALLPADEELSKKVAGLNQNETAVMSMRQVSAELDEDEEEAFNDYLKENGITANVSAAFDLSISTYNIVTGEENHVITELKQGGISVSVQNITGKTAYIVRLHTDDSGETIAEEISESFAANAAMEFTSDKFSKYVMVTDKVTEVHQLTEHPMVDSTCTKTGTQAYWECTNPGCNKLFADADATMPITEPETIPKKEHNLTHHEAVAATCETEGSIEYWQCESCKTTFRNEAGTKIATSITTEKTAHDLTYYEAVAATCTADGNNEYWLCSGCGKYFSDENAATKTTQEAITVPATGHQHLTHTEAASKTCTTDGNIEYWYCSDCESYYSDEALNNEITQEQTIISAGHELEHFAAADKTCTANGNIEYWHCTACQAYFSNEAGTAKITQAETIIPAGHTLEHVAAVDATCAKEGNIEHWKCDECGKTFSDENGTTEAEDVATPKTAHSLEKLDKKDSSCTETGYVEHWECTACHACFEDDEGKTPLTEEQVTIAKKAHTLQAYAAVEETCTENGSIAYWQCSVCMGKFSDENGTTGVTDEEIVIPAGHVLTAHNAVPATCTEGGVEAYWSCSRCGSLFKDEAGNNKIDSPVATAPAGHDWNAPDYVWAEDNSKVTATRICNRDTSHPETETVNTTYAVTTPAAVGVEGVGTYTAVFMNAAFAPQTKNVAIPAIVPTMYTVTFDSDGGSPVEPQTVAEGGKATKPADPTREGYTFKGWFLGESAAAFDFDNTPITSNITLKAKWEAKAPDQPSTGPMTVGDGNYNVAANGTAVYTGPAGDPATVTIPDTITVNGKPVKVTTIADKAFAKKGKLKTITIGKNIETIGKSAFESCKSLTTIKGGKGVVTIKDKAFAGCAKLKTIPAFEKLQTIGASAFKGDKVLASLTLSANVKKIGKDAFNECAALKKITIKTTKLTDKNVGKNAFKGINSKATFKCPKGKAKDYQKILQKKGAPKTAKFK